MFIKLENLNYCRICTKTEDNDPFIPVFDSASKITLKIYLISGIQINETTENSAVVCSQCLEDLNSAYELRNKCIDAEEFFKLRFLQNNIEIEPEVFNTDFSEYKVETDLLEETIQPCYSKTVEHKKIKPTKTVKAKRIRKPQKQYKKRLDEKVSCQTCFKVLKNQYCLPQHMKIFHSELSAPAKCDICSLTFKRGHYLIAHQKLMHSEESIQETTVKKYVYPTQDCPICGRTVNGRYMKIHIKLKHVKMSEIDPSELYHCDLCGYKAKIIENLRQHINSRHVNAYARRRDYTTRESSTGDLSSCFICSTCGKQSPSRSALINHEKIHKNQEVACPICSKVIVSKERLTLHMRTIHERSTTLACPDCDYVTPFNSSLHKHRRRIHLKLKDKICSECGDGFSTCYQLKAHFRIHTGERPYNCSFCNKDFRIKTAKSRHEKICPNRTRE